MTKFTSGILLVFYSAAIAGTAVGQSIYTIGNSLTWDARPSLLEGDVSWHVTCNKNLEFIYNNPNSFCLDSSDSWYPSFKSQDFDYVTVQPFTGTDIKKDAEIISVWMQNQPSAEFIVHTGWSSVNTLDNVYPLPNSDGQMRHSKAYFGDLLHLVAENHPDREVKSTYAVDLLYSISLDIDAGVAPFSSLNELYRDSIHMDHQEGRYLMHNALRNALDQPFSNDGFDVAPHIASYLNQKIIDVQNLAAEYRTMLENDTLDNAFAEPTAPSTATPAGTSLGLAEEPTEPIFSATQSSETQLSNRDFSNPSLKVDLTQLSSVAQMSAVGANITAVPEPHSTALVLLGAMLLFRRRRGSA